MSDAAETTPRPDESSASSPAPLPGGWPELLETLLADRDLSTATAAWAMDRLMSGELADSEVAAFLIAMRAKGETAEELVGLSATMLDKAVPVPVPGPTLDIVGTGGDRLGTVNISTMSSLVAVGAGARVVKHGNRGASTTAGAADVIEALGVDLSPAAETIAGAVDEVGITFLFAGSVHPAMRHVGPVRRQLGVRTIFNFLGPLTNPARVTAQALGCAHERLAPRMAEVLAARGTRGMVFRGRDGRDKITTSDATDLWEVRDGTVTHHEITPEQFGLARQPVEALAGGDGAQNATLVRSVLAGEPGPVREAVLLNAAAGLTALDEDHAAPLPERLEANMARAAASIDDGAAASVLRRWVDFTTAGRG